MIKFLCIKEPNKTSLACDGSQIYRGYLDERKFPLAFFCPNLIGIFAIRLDKTWTEANILKPSICAWEINKYAESNKIRLESLAFNASQ